jgi:hypothetical protein
VEGGGGSGDINTKKMMKVTKIFHGEFMSELIDEDIPGQRWRKQLE